MFLRLSAHCLICEKEEQEGTTKVPKQGDTGEGKHDGPVCLWV